MQRATIDPHTPVLVACSEASQRLPAGAGEDALGLMLAALRSAAEQAAGPHASDLLHAIEWLGVPRGMWRYEDPARALATAVGSPGAHSVMAEIGVLQQTLINRACSAIQAGELELAVVAGGEAKYREQQARRAQVSVSSQEAPGSPDEVWRPSDELWSEIEQRAGLALPVGYYAIMESALRARQGLSIEAHREQLAHLYADFSRVAADNPHAWEREVLTPAEILETGPDNRMLAFPYSKHHNSQWNVDQAAALVFCSAAKATQLGIPRERWLFPRAGTESNHMVNTAQRPDLAASPGAASAGREALRLAQLSAAELELIDLYSCFPVAVQVYARELGLDLRRPLTLTGGMARGGGPLNNYVLQATARAAELMLDGKGSSAMISSVSGMLTKQGFGIYAREPGADGFGFADVSEQVARQWPALELRPARPGERARVAGYTVLHDGGAASRLVAVCDLADGARTVLWSDDAGLMAAAQSEEWVGRDVQAAGEGRLQ